MLILPLLVSKPASAQTSYNFLFNEIPFSDPDINTHFRGAFRWHDMSSGYYYQYPVQGGHVEPKDAYYRSNFPWDALETSQGNYNWAAIDGPINACIQRNQTFSFNIMCLWPGTNNGPSDQGANMHYPQYVHQQMQLSGGNNADWISNGQWVPNWNHDFFLQRVEALLQALATHIQNTSYNGTPYWKVIGYVDIGIFGCWGEWNHSGIFGDSQSPAAYQSGPPAGRQATDASLRRIIDAHRNAFPNVPLLANMHMFDGNQFSNVKVPPATGYYGLTATNNWGRFGLKRMNWGRGWEYYIQNSTLTNPTNYGGINFGSAIQDIWKYAPVFGEGPNYNTSDNGPCAFWNLPNEIRTFHGSDFDNGNMTEPCGQAPACSGQRTADSVRLAMKLSGYRMILTGGSMPQSLQTNVAFQIKLDWRNKGVAPVYQNWTAYYELRNTSTNAVVWSSASTKQLRGFLPSTNNTSTTTTDDVVIPGTVAPGTYKLSLVIKDPNGYRDPFFLMINGRQSDGSYTLRSTVTLASGSSLYVDAGTDQIKPSGTTSTVVSGTVTGGGTNDTALLVVIHGESNAAGMAYNTQATAAELAPRSSLKILNNNTLVFQDLDIGTNNNILQNLPDQTTHGLENGLAGAVESGQLPMGKVYCVKVGASGSRIDEWLSTGSPGGSYGWSSLVSRMNAAINYFTANGIPYKIYVWQSIGINDYNAGTTNALFKSRMEQFRTDFRALFGAGIPFYSTRFFASHPYNTVLDAIAAGDPQGVSSTVDITGATYRDPNVHWDYAGLKLIASRMVTLMPKLATSNVTSWTWTQVSGPTNSFPAIIVGNPYAATISGMTSGAYVFRLTVNGVLSDDILINIASAGAQSGAKISRIRRLRPKQP